MKISDIQAREYHPYYSIYLDQVPDGEFTSVLQQSHQEVLAFLQNIPDDKWEYRYDTDKWTIKEILQHIIDTERIFSYRSLRISRGDMTPLAGYDQDDYVPYSKANRHTKQVLIADYQSTRANTLSLYRSMDEEMLAAIGNANGNAMSARVAFCVLVGHEKHHCNVIRERYLSASTS